MTIEKGKPWGRPGALPDGAPVARSDAEVRAIVEPWWLGPEGPAPVIGLVGGDLARTCGATGDRGRLQSEVAQRLPVDLVEVVAGDRRMVAVAHVVVRRSWWFGPVAVAMNAQYLGPWDVAPRSHPNDGRVDVLEADLPLGVRLAVRSRLTTGTHVPHPDIAQRRVRQVTFDRPGRAGLWIDGERVDVGEAAAVSLTVHPDAFEVVV